MRMRVNNRKCIRKLALRSLMASRKRNFITIIAIILTTLLFTSVFTIALSLNKNYQEYTFRRIGGYSHGTFKDVSAEQMAAISSHPMVKQSGARTIIGYIGDGAFLKKHAEVSFMDKNCTTWSYAMPSVGRMPTEAHEVSMDTKSLELLGLKSELNQKVTLTFEVGIETPDAYRKTDTFLLVGYWEYDEIMPVHYINVSNSYVTEITREATEHGLEAFKSDLNVMMASSFGIRSQMEQVDLDLGYTWDERGTEQSARIGTNWGMTSEQLLQNADPETLAGILIILLIIGITGYLIIYNIFQISVSNDIRHYGLLKAIGVTARQLKHLIRKQALLLCLIGIPIGLIVGYSQGALLTPLILKSMSNSTVSNTVLSLSPVIFIGASVFTFITVWISCMRPAKIASKVSPVDAARYTGQDVKNKTRRKTRRGGPAGMAIASLQRKPGKTLIVFASLAFSLILLNSLYIFVKGFDMEKYLAKMSCADFVVSTTDYFNAQQVSEYIPDKTRRQIQQSLEVKESGCGYTIADTWRAQIWMNKNEWRQIVSLFDSDELMNELYQTAAKQGNMIASSVQMEGLDTELFEKLTLLSGDLDAVKTPANHAVALVIPTDDYGKIQNEEVYPQIGETITITYVNEGYYIDTRTGDLSDDTTPVEHMEFCIKDGKEVDYTVAAHVLCPASMNFRYRTAGIELLLTEEALKKDSGQIVVPMVFLFNVQNSDLEEISEQFLSEITAENENFMYESKATIRRNFVRFKNMFLLVGGLLCLIIAVIGILNFFNVIVTSILSRKREFAVIQAVGMTNRQLKKMLIAEGLLYTLGAVVSAAIISLALYPCLSKMMGNIFWFLSPHLTITPVMISIPIFLILGWSIPTLLYGHVVKESIIDRLREIEQ